MDPKEEAQQHKEKGNNCVKEKKYIEAVLHYTNAIKLDPSDHTFYSNRSLAFLKQQQYPLAMEDAKQTIKLKPDWPKGYFRKGEIELATGHYTEALLSYGCALRLQPNDKSILDAISKTTEMRQRERQADFQIPWLGAGIGIIIGVGLVIADYLATDKPSIKHPILMALLTIAVAMIGYVIGWAYRYLTKCSQTSLLEPPLDLFKDGANKDDEQESQENGKSERNHRYTKAQARQRFKKGRS